MKAVALDQNPQIIKITSRIRITKFELNSKYNLSFDQLTDLS